MAKIPENDDDNNTTNQKTIQLVLTTVIFNKNITTQVTIEFRLNQGSSDLNIAKGHRNIFLALKKNDLTLKIITSQNVTIYTLIQLLDGNKYTSTFFDIIKFPKTSRIYVSH